MSSFFQIRSFFQEFSFLVAGSEPIVADSGAVEEVSVARIDKDFLDRSPKYDGASGSLVDIADSERIFLFDCYGNLLIEVKQGGYCHHNEAHRDNESWNGETVGEAILRTDPVRVHYAAVVHTGYEIRDHHSVGGFSVTLYKPPKGFTLKGWVEEQLRRTSEQIEASIAEINAEA